MKSTTCIAEITNQKNEKYLPTGRNPLVCLPPCLLASCQLRNFPREFIEKCFAVFYQSSCAIYLTWYWPLLFFWEFFYFTWYWPLLFREIHVWWNQCFVNGKLNILPFIFLICPKQFWIWCRWKLTKTIKIFIVFLSFCCFTPCMAFESWFRSMNR